MILSVKKHHTFHSHFSVGDLNNWFLPHLQERPVRLKRLRYRITSLKPSAPDACESNFTGIERNAGRMRTHITLLAWHPVLS